MSVVFPKSCGANRHPYNFVINIGNIISFEAFLVLDFSLGSLDSRVVSAIGVLLGFVNIVAEKISGLYAARHPTASLADLISLVPAVGTTTLVVSTGITIFGSALGIARSLPVLAGIVFVFLAVAWRAARKLMVMSRKKPSVTGRTLVYGAGQIAETLVPDFWPI